jgi:hypothetical protein
MGYYFNYKSINEKKILKSILPGTQVLDNNDWALNYNDYYHIATF